MKFTFNFRPYLLYLDKLNLSVAQQHYQLAEHQTEFQKMSKKTNLNESVIGEQL